MPYLAYPGRMLEKRGGFVFEIFLEGLVLGQDCPNPLKLNIFFSFVVLNVFGKFFVDSTHYAHNREIWGTCKGYVGEWYAGL